MNTFFTTLGVGSVGGIAGLVLLASRAEGAAAVAKQRSDDRFLMIALENVLELGPDYRAARKHNVEVLQFYLVLLNRTIDGKQIQIQDETLRKAVFDLTTNASDNPCADLRKVASSFLAEYKSRQTARLNAYGDIRIVLTDEDRQKLGTAMKKFEDSARQVEDKGNREFITFLLACLHSRTAALYLFAVVPECSERNPAIVENFISTLRRAENAMDEEIADPDSRLNDAEREFVRDFANSVRRRRTIFEKMNLNDMSGVRAYLIESLREAILFQCRPDPRVK